MLFPEPIPPPSTQRTGAEDLDAAMCRLYPAGMAANDPWEVRFDWILTVLQWGALTVGIVLSALDGITASVLIAGTATGGYVIAMQAMPRSIRDGDVIGELMALVGVVASLLAIALTDGIDSPYTLFLTVPVFYASAFHGFRLGVATGLLSAAGVAIVMGALGQEILEPAFVQVAVFYLLIAVTFSQARRILIEERRRREELTAAGEFQARRLERLDTAHNLLLSLSDLADASELNPVTVGEAALRDLALVVPYASGEVSIHQEGTVVVARRGTPDAGAEPARSPISIGGRTLGGLALWPRPDADLGEYGDLIDEALRPVALAFDNIVLLQDIAHRAVREERVRVARELHDEIGPSMASLGLGLDAILHQHRLDPETRTQLETIRDTVTRLVEEVRGMVSDLRADSSVSLVERATALAVEAGADGPAYVVDVHERRPPRAAIAGQLGAILAEAIRNAFEHSGATLVQVEGIVDRNAGTITIRDDGDGFNVDTSPRGHFGIIGMKERAADVGAVLDLASDPGVGTAVSITWGER